MKKTIYAMAAVLGFGLNTVSAQFNYVFTNYTMPYMPLTGTVTSINTTTIWDDNDFSQPIGFNFPLNTTMVSDANILECSALATSLTDSIFSGFTFMNGDLYDRSNASGASTPSSPISYQLTGTSPSRIAIIEFKNAGFFNEYDTYTTNLDYVNFQIWMYENGKAIEFHFGNSSINHAADYFQEAAGKPILMFLDHLNANTGVLTSAYYLKGTSTAPTLDSSATFNGVTDGINAWPDSGAVYRFTPKTVVTGIEAINASLNNLIVYPTVAQTEVNVINGEQSPVSYSIIALNGAALNMDGTLTKGKNTVDISGLASGVYVMDLRANGATKRVKFVKQ